MKEKTTFLKECSIAYFLRVLILEIGLTDLSDNKFCQIFENHPEWLKVFFSQNSNFNPPPINLIEPNAFCELAIKNEWMWKIIDLAQSNGNQLTFDQSQTAFMPRSFFQDCLSDPTGTFLEAIDIYLWFVTAVRDCQLSVALDDSLFFYHAIRGVRKDTPDPLADVVPAHFSQKLADYFFMTMDWEKTLEKLRIDYPNLSSICLREWVRQNLVCLDIFQADHLRPLFGLVPRYQVKVNPTLWIDGKPPEMPLIPTGIPNKGNIEHPSGLIFTQTTMDAILLYCFELGKTEKEVFSELYDPKRIDTVSQEIGIGQAIYLMLVKYHRGNIKHAITA